MQRKGFEKGRCVQRHRLAGSHRLASSPRACSCRDPRLQVAEEKRLQAAGYRDKHPAKKTVLPVYAWRSDDEDQYSNRTLPVLRFQRGEYDPGFAA